MAGKSKLVNEALRIAREGLESLAKDKGQTPEQLLKGFANQKPRVPYEEWRYEFEPTAELLPSKEFNPENLKPGDVIIPLVGDRTSTGRKITSIAGQKLETPAITEGGPDYMRGPAQQEDKSVWASGKGVITGLEGRIDRALKASEAKGYKDPNVYGSYVAMGPQSGDFSTHTAEAIMGMLPSAKIKRADVKEFDTVMRERFPDWPGLMSPKTSDYVVNANAGEHRKAFIDAIDSAYWRDRGAPDVSLARYATTTPELVSSPTEAAGYNIARITPSKKPDVITKVHRSYPSTMHGEYVGGLPAGMTRDELFTQFSRNFDADAPARNYVMAKRRSFGMDPNAFQVMEGQDIEDLIRKVTALKNEYAAGGEVEDDDDVNDALRIAKDVGGGTPVMMEDAKGNKYDAQGNVIPQDNTGPNPQRTEAAPQQNVMFNTAPQNYAQDVQPFIDYAVTPIDRPGMPSEPDLVNVMRIATQVAAQGQPTDDRGQGNFARRRSETVRSLAGASPEGYQSDYKGPFTYNAGDTADFLNTLIDFSPYGALEYAHDVPYEAGRTGDYGTAVVEGGLGALMTTPGIALAGRGIKKGYELAKQFPKLTAGAIGAGAATTGSDEAEAGPARWFSKAVEVARAIPMNKMTGEQALAMLRKGTSPEELRWMGADDFLTGQKSVSKDDLVAFLEKNRVQPKENVLGGGDKPTRREDVRPDADIVAKYRDERDKLQQEYNDIRSRLKGETDFNKYEPLARAEGEKYRELNAITERMIDDQIARMGGLGRPTQYGPGSRYGDRFHTSGGKNYQETTFNIPPKEVELVEWPVIDVFGNVKARYDSKEAAERVARTSGSTVGEPRTTVIQKGYKSSHWPELNTLGHIRTQILEAEFPGSNRPLKLFNVDEAQSDYAQDVRRYGLREENGENFSKKLNEFTQQMADRWVTQRAEQLYKSSPELFSGIEEARSGAMRLANQRGATKIAEELGVSDEFERLVAAEQRYKKGLEPAPYVTNTQHFTDFSIKKALDQAIDSGADYFTFTPGEVHADRYDLARDLDQIEYEPGDYGTYSISAIGKNGKNVLDKDMDIDEIEEYFGKEIAKKIKADEGRKMEDRPYRDWRVLENEQIKAKGDAMVDAYNNIYKKRVEKVVKDATGKKITWEVLPAKTANGIVPRLGFRIDEDVKKASFSDFQKGGRVTGGKSYDNDASVAHALALTREY